MAKRQKQQGKTSRKELSAPHNYEAEEGTLCAILLYPSAIDEVATILRPSDFFDNQNQLIYTACLSIYARGEHVDKIIVANELERVDVLPDAGGRIYLESLTELIGNADNVKWYADIVRLMAIKRGLISIAVSLASDAYSEDDIQKVFNKHDSNLESLKARVEGVSKRLQILAIKKLTSKPPKYDVILTDNTLSRISFSALVKYRELRKHVGETLDYIPTPIKQEDWEVRLNKLLESAEMIEAPQASKDEQIKLLIIKHITDVPEAEMEADLDIGRPYQKSGYYHFKSTPLLRILHEKYRVNIEANELWALLHEWGAKARSVRIPPEGKVGRLWGIPDKLLKDGDEEKEDEGQAELGSEITADMPEDLD